MKYSKCYDPKMAAYYWEVRWLEDRFDGLELNHIPWQDNEAADTLAKIASGRGQPRGRATLRHWPSDPRAGPCRGRNRPPD
jgi:hypothetical protein